MKKNVTYIQASKFEDIVTELGMETLRQAGYVKVLGPKGRNLYITKTKTVGHIDFSGFTIEHLGVLDLGEASFGNVKQMINFQGTEESILQTFRDVLVFMKGLPPLEKAPRAKPKGKEALVMDVSLPVTEPLQTATKEHVVNVEPPKALLPRTKKERQALREAKAKADFERSLAEGSAND